MQTILRQLQRDPTAAYVGPFLAFVAVMALERALSVPTQLAYPIRFTIVAAILLLISRPYISLRPTAAWASIGIGIAVFVIWIGPDVLFGPGYRRFILFTNSLTGEAVSSIPSDLRGNLPFAALRVASSVVLVPILEELFWRGWLMRWIISKDFQKVPLGQYQPAAFWAVAILFALEHGVWWDVGLVAGVIYNGWMVRTRSLADCILAHAVTNGLLAVYVIACNHWEYWL